MRANSVNRAEMSRKIRHILIRHLIDTGRLSVSMSAGIAHLRGSLARLPGVGSPLTADMVGTIMSEVCRVDGVQSVVTEFDNWVQSGMGAWNPVVKKHTSDSGSQSKTEIPPDEESL